jgi:predicted type IV restriction endonuclease
MEIEAKENRKLRIDKSIELCEWLMRNQLSFQEAAIVLGCIEEGKSLAESLLIVFVNKNEKERTSGKIPSYVFHDPITC